MQIGLKKVHVCGICMHFFTNLPSHRGRKVLQDLNNQNDERITTLEDSLKTTQEGADESERKFDEVGWALSAQPHMTTCVSCGSKARLP